MTIMKTGSTQMNKMTTMVVLKKEVTKSLKIRKMISMLVSQYKVFAFLQRDVVCSI